MDWDTNKQEKRKDAFYIFYESVLKPDSKLRGCAHNQECFEELMEWRQVMLDLLYDYNRHGIPAQTADRV